jgi:uncharacterized C2H2 Zn-finger protein
MIIRVAAQNIENKQGEHLFECRPRVGKPMADNRG